jgi:hypothetical protein
MPSTDIPKLIHTFAAQLAAAVEQSVTERFRAAAARIVGAPVRRGPGRPPKNAGAPAPKPKAPARAPARLSPAAQRARKLQGRYIGTLRTLKSADRARVKKVANEKGVGEAVALALKLKAGIGTKKTAAKKSPAPARKSRKRPAPKTHRAASRSKAAAPAPAKPAEPSAPPATS